MVVRSKPIVVAIMALLVCGAMVLIIRSAASDSAQKVKPGHKVYTAKDYNQAYYKFRYRSIVEEYKRIGTRSPKWDANALVFLDLYAKYGTELPSAPSIDQLLKAGQEAVDAGCTDPMVQSCYGVTLLMSNKFNEAIPIIERSLAELQKSKYHRIRMAKLPLNLLQAKLANKTLSQEEMDRLFNLGLQLTIDSMSDGSYIKGEERFALESIPLYVDNRPNWNNYLKALDAKPPTSPYVYKVFAARCHINIGWGYRGEGLAYSVTDEGWEGLFSHLKIARKLLVEAYKLHPEYPEAPTEMITVAMAEEDPTESTRVWFDRAVAAQFDYIPAYDKFSWSIRPRWGGSIDELHQFGLECLKTGRYDTKVPWQFFNQLAAISKDLYGDKTYWKDPKNIQYLNSMFDNYSKATGQKEWYMSKKAATAWYCERYGESKNLIDELGDKLDKTAFEQSQNTSFNAARGEIYALGGTDGPKLLNANRLADKGQPSQALTIYQTIATRTKDDKYASEYIQPRIEELTLQSKLSKGGWIDMKVPKDLRGWLNGGGKWTALEDGSVMGSSGNQRLFLQCWYELQDNFEFSADFEILRSNGDANAGVVIHPYGPRNNGGLLATMYKDDKSVSMISFGLGNLDKYPDAICKNRNTMLVQVSKGRETVCLNGKKMGYSVEFPVGVKNNEKYRVGLGSCCNEPGTIVRFYNLKIRKLSNTAE
ncbi:MAG: hypothetical protein ABFD64_00010 [Armatimonadota bacterium]